MDVSRRLVAVFAADVEGYSRLMGADEVGTLKGLTERRAILDGIIGEPRGAPSYSSFHGCGDASCVERLRDFPQGTRAGLLGLADDREHIGRQRSASAFTAPTAFLRAAWSFALPDRWLEAVLAQKISVTRSSFLATLKVAPRGE